MRKFSFSRDQAFEIAVGLQLIEGVNEFSTAGFTPALNTNIETDVSTIPASELNTSVSGVATVYFPDNNGEAMEILSDDPDDTGPVQVFPVGPDGAFSEPFMVTLNGTTPVPFEPIAGLLSRINFARNMHPLGFDGTITIRSVNTGNVFANMLEIYQNTTQARFTIPRGKKGLIRTAIGSMRKQGGTDTSLTMLVHIKPFEFAKWYHPFGFGLQRSGSTTVNLVNAYPEAIEGPFDMALSANAFSSGAEVAGRLSGLIVDA